VAGVTVKTLHHYDRVGLLQPPRTASRYRVYTAGDLARLQHILALRALGLPLRIREPSPLTRPRCSWPSASSGTCSRTRGVC
jgi:hypothetical protein